MLQSAADSAPQAICTGSVTDMYDFRSRGRVVSILLLGMALGILIGPPAGGFVDQYLDWQWICYVAAIFGGLLCIANALLLDETLYCPSYVKSYNENETIIGNWLSNFKFNPVMQKKKKKY